MLRHGAVYLASIGGEAPCSKSIVKAELVAFGEAGPEGLFRFEVERFPTVVINDQAGQDYYEMCVAAG